MNNFILGIIIGVIVGICISNNQQTNTTPQYINNTHLSLSSQRKSSPVSLSQRQFDTSQIARKLKLTILARKVLR